MTMRTRAGCECVPLPLAPRFACRQLDLVDSSRLLAAPLARAGSSSERPLASPLLLLLPPPSAATMAGGAPRVHACSSLARGHERWVLSLPALTGLSLYLSTLEGALRGQATLGLASTCAEHLCSVELLSLSLRMGHSSTTTTRPRMGGVPAATRLGRRAQLSRARRRARGQRHEVWLALVDSLPTSWERASRPREAWQDRERASLVGGNRAPQRALSSRVDLARRPAHAWTVESSRLEAGPGTTRRKGRLAVVEAGRAPVDRRHRLRCEALTVAACERDSTRLVASSGHDQPAVLRASHESSELHIERGYLCSL